ncbi:hypothetical protein ABEB36_007973 [Hypothenemus hampei]|uniref:Uncharacterized protein n=1 Tax=Hypothenemus hampei TaxID=57062 RepID=A0ABD1EKF9_HYPHA
MQNGRGLIGSAPPHQVNASGWTAVVICLIDPCAIASPFSNRDLNSAASASFSISGTPPLAPQLYDDVLTLDDTNLSSAASPLPEGVLQALGEDPSQFPDGGHTLYNGLATDVTKSLSDRHTIPDNCKALNPPQINFEILPDQIARGLSASGKGINYAIEISKSSSDGSQGQTLPLLMDAGRIFGKLF